MKEAEGSEQRWEENGETGLRIETFSVSSQARKLADFVRSVKLSSRYTLMMSTRHRSQTRCSTGSSGSPPMSTMPDCASSVRFSLSIGWIVNRANVPAEASCEALVRNDGFRKTVESTICSREMLLVSSPLVAEHFRRREDTDSGEVLLDGRRNDDIGSLAAHLDEVVMRNVEVQRVEHLGWRWRRKDRIKAVAQKGHRNQLWLTRGMSVVRREGDSHLRCRKSCRQVLAMTSFASGSSVPGSGGSTSGAFRKNSCDLRDHKTSTEVTANDTSLMLNMVGLGNMRMF